VKGRLIVPVLAALIFSLTLLATAYAQPQPYHEIIVRPGQDYTVQLNGTGWYELRWRAEAAGSRASIISGTVVWNGYEYHTDGYGVWAPYGHWVTERVPAGSKIVYHAERGPARVQYIVRHVENGIVFPVNVVLPPFSHVCFNVSGQGRYGAVAYIEGHPGAWSGSNAFLIGSEKSDYWSIIAMGKYLYARGENIRLCLENRKNVPLNVTGYVLLDPLPQIVKVNVSLIPERPNDAARLGGLGLGLLVGLLAFLALSKR